MKTLVIILAFLTLAGCVEHPYIQEAHYQLNSTNAQMPPIFVDIFQNAEIRVSQ